MLSQLRIRILFFSRLSYKHVHNLSETSEDRLCCPHLLFRPNSRRQLDSESGKKADQTARHRMFFPY